jgi:hypothetical protein
MGVRSQLSWVIKGRATTQAALESLSTDLRALQEKVSKELPLLRDRQLDEFDKVRAAVAAATDDLMARVEALRQQVDKS